MTEALLEIGKIVGTHGLRGDLKVRLHSGDPELLLSLNSVSLTLPNGEMITVEINRHLLHKGQVLLRLQGYESIDFAEPLVGSLVLVAENLLPELDADEYYWKQLDGLQVIDCNLGEIGLLKDLFTSGAHDTYVVKGKLGEILIPAVQQFIIKVDIEERVMHVALPEGLVSSPS